MDIEPAAAIEAVNDPDGLIARDPKSVSGEAIRVIGYSSTAARVLVVVLIPDQHPSNRALACGDAWPANRRQRHTYTTNE